MAAKKDTYITTFKAEGTDQFERQAKRAQHSVRNMAKETGELKKQLRFMRGGLGQVGHQVQDIAVQLQAGTNGLIVFGQQGSQIASLFGPQGAVIGAILAVGAAIGTALLPELFKTVDHAKDFEDAFKRITDRMQETGGATNDLSAEMAQLARISAQALENELASAAFDAQKATESAVNLMIDKFAELDDTSFLSFRSGLTDLGDVINEMRNLNGVIQPPTDTTAFLAVVNKLGQKFGETGKDATMLGQNIVKAVAKVKFDPTIRNVEELQKLLNDLNMPEKEMLMFVTSLNEDFTKLYNNAESFGKLMDAVANSSAPTFDPNISEPKKPKADDSADKKLELQNKFLESLRQEVELYGATESELTVQRAIQMGISGEKLEQVAINAQNLQSLKDQTAEKLAQEALAEKEKRDAQALAERQDDFLSKLQDEVNFHNASQRALTLNRAVQMGITGEKLGQIALLTLELEKLNEINQAENERIANIQRGGELRREYGMTEVEQMAIRYAQELEYMEQAGATQQELHDAKMMMQDELLQKQIADNELLSESMRVFEDVASGALKSLILEGTEFSDVLRNIGRSVVGSLIDAFAKMAAQYIAKKLAMLAFDKTAAATTLAKDVAMGTATAAAYAPAAAAASLATGGANAIPAQAGIAATFSLSKMLSLMSFEGGGYTGAGARSGGMDGKGGFLAMVHPNESIYDHAKGEGIRSGQGQEVKNITESTNVNVTVNGMYDSGEDLILANRDLIYQVVSDAKRRQGIRF